MKAIKILLVLIVLFISISAVSAEGNYTALQDEIDTSTDSIEITDDYVYDDSTDYELGDGIVINKTDFTIYGNGHSIDAKSQARIFDIRGDNITIFNLIFINGYANKSGGAIISDRNVNLIDCLFENNTAENGGAVCFINEKYGGALNFQKGGETDDVIVSIENCNFTGNIGKKGGAIYSNATLTLNNTTFIGNNATGGGGALYIYNETQITNCLFMNNSAISGGVTYLKSESIIINSTFANSMGKYGSAVYAEATVIISDSVFENLVAAEYGGVYSEKYFEIMNCIFTNNTAKWGGSIYSEGTLNITNSSFSNSKSKYAAAIYAQGNITIRDTVFENMSANETAGAMGLRNAETIEITNCTFINSEARKNGGAIYMDLWENSIITTKISNSTFINSTGDFGGALVQLRGTLIIENSTFTGNTAIYAGSAAFVSNANFGIQNCSFESNKILDKELYGGGTLYCDLTNFISISSTFKDNDGNGIYCYDADLNISRNEFEGNCEAIHCVFCQPILLEDNIYNDDILILNDTDYASVMMSSGMKLELINNTIDVTDLPARFDLRDWGWVSSVKDQGDLGSCWTFGACGALESALLKATGIEYNFSESNLQNNLLEFSKYGIMGAPEGGWQEWALEYMLTWFGPLPAEYCSYDEMGKLSPVIVADENIHIQDAILLKQRANSTDNDEIKKALIKYGSIHITYNGCQEAPDYNEDTFAQYQNTSSEQNHAVSLVGWDDNFPKEKFLITPPGDGAWIIKNSWGDFGDNGYQYISYYDISIINHTHNEGFVIINTEDYTVNYQTDLGGYLKILEYNRNVSYKVTYSSLRNELISAVGTYFAYEGEEYLLEIYVNDELKHTQNGTAPFRGFHTVKLTSEIQIKEGDNFTAVMKKQSIPIIDMSRQHYLENMSFYDLGDGWKDIFPENITFSLKVYTKDLAIYTEDLVKIYKNDSKFEAEIGIANETVTFEINGGSYNRTSDANGTARIAINLGPGNYTIKTTFNGTSVENTITVLPTLIADNLVKYFRNTSQFFISLIGGEGNPVAGVNITMNINGVFYNRETNENGTAKLNINLIPGEYILTAIDPLTGLMMSYNITVLPTLNATDLEMTYKDGSTFNVSVLDGQGNLLADAKVTFNINGVFYNRYSDSKGIANLNITLMAGEYIITSEYDGFKIANTIIIKD
ncbi:MAG: hypothetical protein IK044_03910 [Methanobrevibacter sp.]|nr:hypothetical protein [Methanobrevibacter sp.]